MAITTLLLGLVMASDLTIEIKGVGTPKGDVGCALFSQAQGFPMDRATAKLQKHPAKADGNTCAYTNLPAGRYAVAVSVERNQNGKTDKNFIGIPTEEWGVSNGVRPKMRAPNFEEAAFELKEGEKKTMVIEVAK